MKLRRVKQLLACTASLAMAVTAVPVAAQQQQQSISGDRNDTCATQMDRWVELKFEALRQGIQTPGNSNAERIAVGSKRVLQYGDAIGRIEVDRYNVVSVSAPTPSSLRLTGVGEGETSVSVYGRDGALIEETRVAVVPRGSPVRPSGNWFPEAGEKVVAIDVQFAVVSDSTLKALGFNFSKLSGDIQGAIVSPSSLTSFKFGGTAPVALPNGQEGVRDNGLSLEAGTPIQGAFNLLLAAPNRGISAVMSALQSNGLSEVLAQPTLLAHSGEKATFLAGGEFPIPVPQSSGSGAGNITVEYKPFGVRLAVMPRVVSANQIVLMVAPEVSEPDYTTGVRLQGFTVPGLRRRCAETTVELASGQSFVIAGLNYSSSAVTREKVPFLGDIPVLGAFFKRQQNQKERQELIIVATPRLVDPLRPEDVPPLPSAKVDPSFGDMILGTDGLDQAKAPFGVVRR